MSEVCEVCEACGKAHQIKVAGLRYLCNSCFANSLVWAAKQALAEERRLTANRLTERDLERDVAAMERLGMSWEQVRLMSPFDVDVALGRGTLGNITLDTTAIDAIVERSSGGYEGAGVRTVGPFTDEERKALYKQIYGSKWGLDLGECIGKVSDVRIVDHKLVGRVEGLSPQIVCSATDHNDQDAEECDKPQTKEEPVSTMKNKSTPIQQPTGNPFIDKALGTR